MICCHKGKNFYVQIWEVMIKQQANTQTKSIHPPVQYCSWYIWLCWAQRRRADWKTNYSLWLAFKVIQWTTVVAYHSLVWIYFMKLRKVKRGLLGAIIVWAFSFLVILRAWLRLTLIFGRTLSAELKWTSDILRKSNGFHRSASIYTCIKLLPKNMDC